MRALQYIIADGDWSELFSVVFGYILLYIVGFIVGVFCVLLPLGAVALRAAAKWIASIDAEFGKAYTTLLLAGIIEVPVFIITVFLIPFSLFEIPFSWDLRWLCFCPVAFIVQTPVISWRLSVPFSKALLVSLVTLLVFAGIIAVGYFARLFGTALFLS